MQNLPVPSWGTIPIGWVRLGNREQRRRKPHSALWVLYDQLCDPQAQTRKPPTSLEATLRSSSSLFPHVAEQPTGAPGLVGRTMPAGCLFCHCVPLGGKELYNQYSQRHQVNAFWRQLAGREGDAPDSGRPVNLSRNQPAEKTICLSSHW